MRTKKNTGLNLKNEYSEGKTLVPHRKTNQEKAILDSSDLVIKMHLPEADKDYHHVVVRSLAEG